MRRRRKQGNPLGEARVLNQLGSALRRQGRAEEAMTRHREAGDLYRAMGNSSDEASAVNGLAHAHRSLGQDDRAREHGRLALRLYEELGVPETADMS